MEERAAGLLIEAKVGTFVQAADLGVGALLRKSAARPGPALRYLIALLRGYLCRASCWVRGRQFSAGRLFRVFGRMDVRGPGRVEIGDNVAVWGHVTPWTMAPGARIVIGDDVQMSGTRFSCCEKISIGNRCTLADAHIMDSDFHSLAATRRTRAAPVRTSPVVIEENVWVAARVGILPGTRIGRNSVVGWGAVCVRSYPPSSVVFGNPARVISPVPGAAPVSGEGER